MTDIKTDLRSLGSALDAQSAHDEKAAKQEAARQKNGDSSRAVFRRWQAHVC